jgi:peptidoglycan/LPS O-acetylase OafA/YrhL
MTVTQVEIQSAVSRQVGAKNIPIGYLRGFLVALVVAHHAVLAYHPFAPPPQGSLKAPPHLWEAFPVVDPQRWTGFSLLTGFNDVFFMALMFFLSGLFVWEGLQRKGIRLFLRDRLLRLGLPFAAAAAILAPLAYYPAYLQRAAHPSIAEYGRQWLSLGEWPAGPAWFVWVLLVFDALAALLYLGRPKWGNAIGRPGAFFGLLVIVSAAVYVPMAILFTPFQWTDFGPFAFQTSRILYYCVYFAAGIAVGAWGLDKGLLARGGKLAQRWLLWVIAAPIVFGIAAVLTIVTWTAHPQSRGWQSATDFLAMLSCAVSSFAFLALFVRFAVSRVRFFDSLRDNSYGIYLVHYAFVSWLQYALLGWSVPGAAKGLVAFAGALALSWVTTATIRRIPGVARVV